MISIRERLTATAFRYLHRRGLVRVVNSMSNSAERSPVTMRVETWPRVPEWVVGRLADRRFGELYPARARTFYRKSIDGGPVTVAGYRVWIIRYAPSTSSLADALRLNL